MMWYGGAKKPNLKNLFIQNSETNEEQSAMEKANEKKKFNYVIYGIFQ